MEPGKVYLIGAGPGDPGLLTVKGKKHLQEADVILYDRLVHPLLLEYVKEDAERIYCGKLPDRHYLRQEAIQQLMIEKAEAGLRVVRLKGGDPGMFGRAGEEAEALKAAGIPYELVPGITAGMAAPLYAGIPVTHRDYSGSFAAVTGHTKTADGSPAVDWKALAEGIDTIAFYMGVKNLGTIAEQLIRHGRPADTPAAIIEWGTTGKQRVVEAPLDAIKARADLENIQNPAITLVGETALLHQKLNWVDQKPLFGQFIWVVKTSPGGGETAEHLRAGGAEVIEAPAYSIDTGESKPLPDVKQYPGIYFTCAESIPVFFEKLRQADIDVRHLPEKIMGRTDRAVKALKKHGILAEKGVPEAVEDFLLVCPDHESPPSLVYADSWTSHKLRSSDNTRKTLSRLIQEHLINTIVFPSSKAVDIFWKELDILGISPVEWGADKSIVCYGPHTEKAAEAAGLTVEKTLSKPDAETLVESFSGTTQV
ncbi:uroporphyrinogen-III C-methyltransferase [Salibacterium aidingense]|uniref:uroporphyrinogen-III C-methyltransferase n=1 Tax=Salibacterium aidingense TaxID=384933 RepID=UPI00040FED4D|nr:uroporphyrinogen-III C-methyltransferase [Salibacterium aidingense]